MPGSSLTRLATAVPSEMAVITYQFVDRCEGGGHFRVDIDLNSGQWGTRAVYTTDEVRAPLGDLTLDERETLALLILKLNLAGKTRGEIVSKFQAGPVTVVV
jgi:hypothetical protein